MSLDEGRPWRWRFMCLYMMGGVEFCQVQFVLSSARLGVHQGGIGLDLVHPGVPGGEDEEWD